MSKSNSDQLKIYNSPVYRRRIKRMVEMVKTVRGIHGKIPRGGLPKLPDNASDKEKRLRSEAEARRVNIASIHYFAAPITGYGSQSSAPASSDNSSATSSQ